MPRAKRSQADNDQRRRALVSAARALIAEVGLAGVTARALAQRLGWAVGTIYTIAPSLDDITLEANAEELVDLYEALDRRRIELSGASPRTRALGVAQAYLAFTAARGKSWDAVFERGVAGAPPEWYLARQAALFDLLADVLRPLTPTPGDDRRAARVMWAALQGFLTLAAAGHLTRHLGDEATGASADAARDADYLLETLLDGLTARL